MHIQTVIDVQTFEALRDAMGADFITELLQTYYTETSQLLTTLRDALARRDCDAFRRAAHSIKSTSNSFGALEFGTLAKELEFMGREGTLEGAPEKVQVLESDFRTVQQALEELSHGEE